MSGTGSIRITGIMRGVDVDNSSAALQTYYSYVWHEGATDSSPVLGSNFGVVNREVASGLPSGRYAVTIRKETVDNGDDLGCFSTVVFSIGNDTPTLVVSVLDVLRML